MSVDIHRCVWKLLVTQEWTTDTPSLGVGRGSVGCDERIWGGPQAKPRDVAGLAKLL